MTEKGFTLQELADRLQCEWVGSPSYRVTGVSGLDKATSCDASFLANDRYLEAMQKSNAGVICIDTKTTLMPGKNFLISPHPSRTFQSIVELFFHRDSDSSFHGVHPTALIDPSAKIGVQVTIGPYVVIDANAQIGDHVTIGALSYIGQCVTIGASSYIYPSCVVRENCQLGQRVILQSGSIIGSCGFGYTTNQEGVHHKLEQLGIVIIEDDVEIGANTTIDRSRFDKTIVRKGSKIDNLVQIAHNVEIGEHNLIAAQTGIAGSSKTGHHVIMGGQVGVAGHIVLDNHVAVSSQSGVSKSLKSGTYRGTPAIPIQEFNRHEVYLRRIENYASRIQELEKKIANLENLVSQYTRQQNQF